MTALSAVRLGVLTPAIDLEAYGPTSAISEAELVRGYSRTRQPRGEPGMGKIVASYLVKVHLHAPDGADEAELEELTNDGMKAAIIEGLGKELSGAEITVSLIERTDD